MLPADGAGSNREPTAGELATCRTHLAAEIELIEPQVIVTTGGHATRSVLATDDGALDSGFLDAVLEPVEHVAFDTTVLPILHPSYQAVWLSRLGYTRAEYLDEIGSTLKDIDAGPRTEA